MTNAQSRTSFWPLTLASAKDAVRQYFEPLRHITAWLPARRPELEDCDVQPVIADYEKEDQVGIRPA